MIAFLRGKIINKTTNYAIIEVENVGYSVYINERLLGELPINQEVEIYTHQYVREDALDLFGFKTLADLEFFELLLTVSGIGPKSAMGVLSIASADDIKETILRGDSTLLTKVSGIGKKTAERLVLELREKIGKLNFYNKLTGEKSVPSSDEIDALMALGYSLQQAREALGQVDPQVKGSGERIREALKVMGK
jgi:Holliday junction DNA helicase RuvA